MTDSIAPNWQLLGEYDPKSLAPAIAQIHRGAQFISMVGKHYVENQADDSHTNMEWIESLQVLAGNRAKSPKGDFRFAIRPKDLTLLMFNAEMTEVDNCRLHGLTKSQVLDWIKIHLHQFDVDSDKMKMDIHYDIPHHDTDDGAPYQLFDAPLFAEMAKYRANSDLVLRHFASQYKTASDVRTWPHHYDNGAYIPVVFGPEGEHLKSFSIGMGIPDEASDEPYFYITTWSKAGDNSCDNARSLPAGEWISSPFSGAVLRASEIIRHKTAEDQLQCVFDFLETGIKASREILE